MNETKAIFSFCFSEDQFVTKISDRLKKDYGEGGIVCGSD